MQINIKHAFFKSFCLTIALFVFGVRPAISMEKACHNVGTSGDCTLFQEFIQVQPIVAQDLIKLALNDQNVTFGEYTNKTVGDDTYEVTDSSGAKHVFYFDDLQDSKSFNTTISVAGAVCLLNGGKPQSKSDLCYGRLSEAKLNNELVTFGMSAQCFNSINSEPYCKIIHKMKTGELHGFTYQGKQIINPETFKTMQIVSTDEVQKYLSDYTMLSIGAYGLLMRGFKCLSMPQTYRSSTLEADDVLSCTVTYYDPNDNKTYKQTIDFLFDDMYEHNKLTASAGRSGLICSAQGGSATSKGVCAGLTQDMCLRLQSDFDIDTEWNTEAGGCIMKDSQKNARKQKVAQISGSVGVFVLGVITLPVSGGASGVFIAAAIGSSIVLISTVTSGTINAVTDHKFTTALIAANSCLINQCGGIRTQNTTCTTCPNQEQIKNMAVANKTSADCISCATTSVRDIIETVITYNGDFAANNANASAYMIDVLYSVINGTLQPICLGKVATGIETSPWMTIKDISDTAMLVGTVMSLGAGIAGKFAKPNLTTLMDNLVTKIQGLKGANINIAALEALAVTGRMEKTIDRISKAGTSTFNALKNYKKARTWQKLSTKAADFVNQIDAPASTTPTSVYDAWLSSCNKQFPCDLTIDDFMTVEKLNSLCPGT